MIRAVPHALSRPAGFALMKPAEKPQLDAARILTMSGTIAVNLLAFGLLMMPLSMPASLAIPVDEPKNPIIDWLPRQQPEPEKVVIVPPQPPKPVVQPDVRPRSVVPAPTANTATPVLSETGTEIAIDTGASDDAGPISDMGPAVSGPAPMQLEYMAHPAPAYPRNAQRLGKTGTVLLQVLVGVDGRPVEVTIARSSGHGELDRTALEQVLRRWSFRPASRDGRPVQAIGLVPVEFKLN